MSLTHSIQYEKYMLNFLSHLIFTANMNAGHTFRCYKHNCNKIELLLSFRYEFSGTLQSILRLVKNDSKD